MEKEIMDLNYYRFGLPHAELIQYLSRVPVGQALELGCGAGSNCLFLASKGFSATGVDFSKRAISMAKDALEESTLGAQFIEGDITKFNIEQDHYSIIISYFTLMFLSKEQREALFPKIVSGLKPGGFVFLGVFSRDEPGYKELKSQGKIVDGTRILDDGSEGMHFFTKDELLSYFPGFELHHLGSQYTLDTGHGEPHYHDSIALVVKKTG